MVQPSMQDALEDVTFLTIGKDGKTRVCQKYLEPFCDEDVDRAGELTELPNVRIERRDVRNVLAEELRQSGLNGARVEIEKKSRRLYRFRSGNAPADQTGSRREWPALGTETVDSSCPETVYGRSA